MKKYKYIWQDKNKLWYMAIPVISWLNKYYNIRTRFWTCLTSLSEEFVEDEGMWEEILIN